MQQLSATLYNIMTKTEAIAIFGSRSNLAKELGISRATFWRMDDPLPQPVVDQIVGAHYRINEEHDVQLVYVVGGKG